MVLTCFNRDARIIHVTSDMSEDFSFEAELADGLAIETRLLGCRGRGELDVLDAKGIQCLGDGDLGFGVKECVCELLALCPSRKSRLRDCNRDQ